MRYSARQGHLRVRFLPGIMVISAVTHVIRCLKYLNEPYSFKSRK